MSAKSDAFEREIVVMVKNHIGESLPDSLPSWMLKEGIVSGARILDVRGIGSADRKNKTDVIIHLSEGEPIKISAKLLNADYFGNWYGHKRFLDEFGEAAFNKMTYATTNWANDWAKTAKAPFVGVSICFGKRTGQTAANFTDIFTPEDILTIARGYGGGKSTANCMYIANHVATDIEALISCLNEISIETVNAVTETFKVAYRPINPMTEGTNRGKNVYTRFQPVSRLKQKTVITDPRRLFELGHFAPISPTCLNHNRILDDLEEQYNIVVPRKG